MVQKARASSAPGPSGVPYKVDKNYPRLLLRLWRILKVIWSRGKVAHQWRHTDGVWIPKEEDLKNNDQFRTISLLSVEGKIFFSIVARCLTDYILRSSYIDTSVQKGGIPKVSGCLEHTGGQPADQVSPGKQGGPGGVVAGPRQRLLIHTPQAGRRGTKPAPSTRQV